MVDLSVVEDQLKAANCNFRFWGRSELKELCHVLIAGETIASCVNGQYESGFAMLCVTDMRVMLIDKKPKYLSLKDIRFEMITELDFSHKMLDATISVHTPNKTLHFTAFNQTRLRKLYHYVQEKVALSRQHPMLGQFTPALSAHIAQLAQQLQQQIPAGFDATSMSGMSAAPEPALTYVPNMAQEYLQQIIPTQAADDTSSTEPMQRGTQDAKATAYANMPLIMSGWRRRVYGYHSKSYKERLENAS